MFIFHYSNAPAPLIPLHLIKSIEMEWGKDEADPRLGSGSALRGGAGWERGQPRPGPRVPEALLTRLLRRGKLRHGSASAEINPRTRL